MCRVGLTGVGLWAWGKPVRGGTCDSILNPLGRAATTQLCIVYIKKRTAPASRPCGGPRRRRRGWPGRRTGPRARRSAPAGAAPAVCGGVGVFLCGGVSGGWCELCVRVEMGEGEGVSEVAGFFHPLRGCLVLCDGVWLPAYTHLHTQVVGRLVCDRWLHIHR